MLKIESVIESMQRLGNPVFSLPASQSGRISQGLPMQPDFEAKVFENSNEFSVYYKTVSRERLKIEEGLAAENRDKPNWQLQGYCEVCEKKTNFLVERNNPNSITPRYRSTLTCERCGLMNRRRFMAALVRKLVRDDDSIYIYERITNFYNIVQQQLKNVNLVGSEYLGQDKKPGETIKELKVQNRIVKDVRHENALDLSFDNESFDLVVSQDVFEHVPDISKTLKEAYRILRKNGYIVMSIPFTFARNTVQRAVLNSGNIDHILAATYHGNPLSKSGSLVFFDYGWDFLDLCKNAGFSKAYMLGYYSFYYGYIGRGLQIMFIAEK